MAKILGWPLCQGQSSALAWWRGDQKPSLSIYDGGRRWTDHGGDGRHGDQIDLLAKVVGIELSAACKLFIDIARCVAAGGVFPAVPVPAPVPVTRFEKPLVPRKLYGNWRRGTQEEHRQLAELRRFPDPSAFLHLTEPGCLFFGDMIDGGNLVPGWLITDPTRYAAQARRLDGEPLDKGEKAKTLKGFRTSWPIGLADTKDAPPSSSPKAALT